VIYSTTKFNKENEIVMRMKYLQTFIAILFVTICISGFSQEITKTAVSPVTVTDSLKMRGYIFEENQKKPQINLSTDQALKFLKRKLQPQYWKKLDDPLRHAFGQLIFEASNKPYDSCEYYLKRYPFDSLNVSWDKFYIWEPLKLKIPVIFPPKAPLPIDSLQLADTNKVADIDTSRIPVLQITKKVSRTRPVTTLKDTTILVVVDTLHEVSSDYKNFPFVYFNYPYQSDSIQIAVKLLLDYLEARDSSIINITGTGNVVMPIWLNSKSGTMQRYWLKNDLNDSVTVWIGATSRNTLGLYLEKGLDFRRLIRQTNYSKPKIEIQEINKSKLLEVKNIPIKPKYWKYRTEASFALNQASLTNWVKGGESNISTSLDITGYADYENKPLKMTSNNFARIKFGLIATSENGIRKNLDLLETNSKLNHKAFGKFDFSAILLFKSQIAKGYNYPNDSIPVSKFFNPAIITAGIGLDYKPNKNTSINFSPLSYKGTFVPDTARIDQTKYGIPANRRSLHEPGVSFLIANDYIPFKTVKITNRLQLFTNYIHNPQNVDIDWEMIVTANLNWFTEVRLNTHLIFDDDTKTPVLDKKKKPVLDAYGKPKTAARVQFKELIGLSFVFRF
jgi:hypothetical protein